MGGLEAQPGGGAHHVNPKSRHTEHKLCDCKGDREIEPNLCVQ